MADHTPHTIGAWGVRVERTADWMHEWMVGGEWVDVGWMRHRGRKLKYMVDNRKMHSCAHSKHHHTPTPTHTILLINIFILHGSNKIASECFSFDIPTDFILLIGNESFSPFLWWAWVYVGHQTNHGKSHGSKTTLLFLPTSCHKATITFSLVWRAH